MFVHMNITHIIDHICIINISSSSHRFCVYWIYHIHNTTTLSHHVILLPYIHHLCATSCSLFNVSISIHNSLQRERMTCIDTTHVAWSLLPRRSLSYQLHSFSDHTHIYYHQMAISWLTLFINMWKESHMLHFLFLLRPFLTISLYVFITWHQLYWCHFTFMIPWWWWRYISSFRSIIVHIKIYIDRTSFHAVLYVMMFSFALRMVWIRLDAGWVKQATSHYNQWLLEDQHT